MNEKSPAEMTDYELWEFLSTAEKRMADQSIPIRDRPSGSHFKRCIEEARRRGYSLTESQQLYESLS